MIKFRHKAGNFAFWKTSRGNIDSGLVRAVKSNAFETVYIVEPERCPGSKIEIPEKSIIRSI